MAFPGPPHQMRPGGGMVPPPGMFHPHVPFGHPRPPPMMMMPPPPGVMPPGMHSVPPGVPPPILMMPPGMPGQPSIGAEPIVRVPIPSSTANMKVATTVFVGNISEKASDTLIRQILLRCGPIEGWKRVQDATGKLQGFGFCEYADPESTLRALRLLHDLKLGEKALVVKVDAKTRKDLLKYLITKKHSKKIPPVREDEINKEVDKLEEDKDIATAALITEVAESAKSEDGRVKDSINHLLKDYLSILFSSKSTEDIQREHDVKESILFMAKQSGNIDPNSTLEDMDMEDDMKTLVSDEIKRFRESYKRSDESKKEKRAAEKEEEKKFKAVKDVEAPKEKIPRKESPSNRDTSPPPPVRKRSPVRSRSQERQEKEKRREAMRQREREDMMKEEDEYEERMHQRRTRERDKAYKQRLSQWEARERRKEKDCDKEVRKEKERREEMERERKHLGDFLAEYDDDKDDQKYYKGGAYMRRRREREMEIESDERDRLRERDELEELRLQVIEKQAREMLSEDRDKESSEEEESPAREEEEEDVDVPMDEEDIPLTKSGYNDVPPAYPPIQVHSAPSVNAPNQSQSTGFQPVAPARAPHHLMENEHGKQRGSEGTSPAASYDSPTQPKLAFGLKKTTGSTAASAAGGMNAGVTNQAKSKLDKVFTAEDDEQEEKPKKKLVPIEYSDEEDDEDERSPQPPRKRSRHSSSGKGSSSRRRGSNSDVGMVTRGGSSLSAGEGLMGDVGDRKLTADERKRMVQKLVNNIPTAKEEVFEYQLKWDQIDKNLIEKRIDPWINKKITEYIGESEPILTEFICNKLSCHISPNDILADIAMVLDDEAEVFIVKLWRLLIYETEAKHLGIAKSY